MAQLLKAAMMATFETVTSKGIASLRDLYAHALALEAEAASHYRELGNRMEQGRHPGLAEVFRHLADMKTEHAKRVARASPDVETSGMPAWEYAWEGAQAGESPDQSTASYQALQLAYRNEERARRFYEAAAGNSPNPAVRRLAAEFAAEERDHIEHIEAALHALDRPAHPLDHDLEPPRELD